MKLTHIQPKWAEPMIDTHFFECEMCSFGNEEDILREPKALIRAS
jgi:hypothetical protein